MSRKILDYVLVQCHHEKEIYQKSNEGYELVGGPFWHGVVFYQAMAKYEESKFALPQRFMDEAFRNIQKTEAEHIASMCHDRTVISIKKFSGLFTGDCYRLMHCFTRSNSVEWCIVALHFDPCVSDSIKTREIRRLRNAIENYAILEQGKVWSLSMKIFNGDKL